MFKREVKRQIQEYGKYFDIILSLVFISLLVIPILSVINLSPKQAPDLEEEVINDVLGVETYTGDEIQLKLIGGSHNFIQNEELYRHENLSFIYSTHILTRVKGIFSKPILQLDVPEGESVEIKFSVAHVGKSSSQIGITYDDTNQILRAEDGLQFIRSYKFTEPGSYKLSLDIRNEVDINFPEDIDLHVKLYPLELESE